MQKQIPWKFVEKGENAKQKMSNARLAISLTRKLGAMVYITPKDIVELKSNMIVTLVAAILGLSAMS